MYTVDGMCRRRRKIFPMTKKCSQNPGFQVHLSGGGGGGGGGRGSKGGGFDFDFGFG